MTRHVDFFSIAIYLSVLDVCVYAYMIRSVVRVVHFRNLIEMHFPRLWLEHRRHFRDSKIRKVLVVLIAITIACLLLGKFLR